MGENRGQGLFSCVDWVNPMGKARLAMVAWVRLGKKSLECGLD